MGNVAQKERSLALSEEEMGCAFEPRGPAVQKHEESLLEAVWPRETESIPEMPGVETGHGSIRRTHSQGGL